MCPKTEAEAHGGVAWAALPRPQYAGPLRVESFSAFAERGSCGVCNGCLYIRYRCEGHTDWVLQRSLDPVVVAPQAWHIHCGDAGRDFNDGVPVCRGWACWDPDPCRPVGTAAPIVCFRCFLLAAECDCNGGPLLQQPVDGEEINVAGSDALPQSQHINAETSDAFPVVTFSRDRWSIMYDPAQPLQRHVRYYQLLPQSMANCAENLNEILRDIARDDALTAGVPAVLGAIPGSLLPQLQNEWQVGGDDMLYACSIVQLARADFVPYRCEFASSAWPEKRPIIRSQKVEDLDAILQLLEVPADALTRAGYLRKSIHSGLPVLCAQDESGAVVGACQIHLDGITVGGLAVARSHQRHGIATELVSNCVAMYFESNPQVCLLRAVIVKGNDPSLRTFKRVGFRILDDEFHWVQHRAPNETA